MYELLIVPQLPGLRFADGVDDWRRGDTVELPVGPVTVQLPARDKPLPKCFRSLAPVFADELIATLRAKGADNLQTVPLRIEIVGRADVVTGYSIVNVVGRISIASFFGALPNPETFGPRRDKVAAAMLDVATLEKKLATKCAELPAPQLIVARLSEANKPLLVRSDVARELDAMQTGATIDDVRFCDMYIGTGFYQVVSDVR